MKVKKQPGRKLQPVPAEVAEFVNSSLAVAEEDLSRMLAGPCEGVGEGFSRWPFPKSDLFHWVGLLDRFDDILSQVIETNWNKETLLQREPFTQECKLLIMRMLDFTRLLLENCSSRNIYCSYDRLKKLLVSDDLLVLEKTLELLLIPSRKLDSQSSLRNTFEREVGTDELAILAQLALPFIPEMGELEEAKFALRFREHHSSRLLSLSKEDAGTVQYIKMLATAIFLMAQPDGSVDSAFFAMSPTLVADTAKLVTPAPMMPMKVELAALSILRSCLKSHSRWNEIIYALNLCASHGPIATIYRNMVDGIISGVDELPYPPMFVYAYMDFVSVLATQVDMDDSFVNSGFVVEAVRSIDAIHPRYYKIFEKTLYVLDALVHHYATALDFFFINNGLLTIVKQITNFIDSSIMALDSEPDQPPLCHSESILLQCLLRFVDKLLVTNGADDRLRNLLEGPLFKSLVVIFERAERFSVDIVAHAVSITAGFIHNEPTALSVLQEMGTPQSLLKCVKKKIPNSAELLAKIPYAFSAICLNQVGTEHFAQMDPVVTLCEAFLDLEMLKLLRSRSTASSLGTAMDEFVRHHPKFRQMVISDIVKTLERVPAVIAELHDNPQNSDHFVGCKLVDSDSPIPGEKRTEPLLSQILETLSSFIEGVVQTPTHSREFIDAGGVYALLEIFYAPGISFDFTVYNESLSISHMLRVLSDVDGDHVISSVLRHWVRHAPEMDELLSEVKQNSFFSTALFGSGVIPTDKANRQFQLLTSTLAVIGLLRDLYVTHSYTFARVGGALLKGFTTIEGEAAIVLLAILLKVSSWEFGQLVQSLDEGTAAAVLLKAKSDFKTPVFSTFSSALAQLPAGRTLQSLKDDELRQKASSVTGPIVRNVLYLSLTLQRLMTNISAIFSGLSKMLSSRSVTPDVESSQKLCDHVANCGINAINWLNVEGKVAPLGLRSFLVTQVMQFLPVIFFDEAGSRTSLMDPVVNTFVSLGGVRDLTVAIQEFMLTCLKAGNLSINEFSVAVKEIVNFFVKISNPNLKFNGDRKEFNKLRDMVCLYCLEFLELPIDFRGSLGAPILSAVLVCFSNLVHLSIRVGLSSNTADTVASANNDDTKSALLTFDENAYRVFDEIAKDFLSCAPETVIEVANLMKNLVRELSEEDFHVEDDEDSAKVKRQQHGRNILDRVQKVYGWILTAQCPLPVDVRLGLLAASVNSKVRKYIYPMLVQALSSFISAIEKAEGSQDKKSVASGVLLVAEIIYMSTIPIIQTPLEESNNCSLHSESIDPILINSITSAALELLDHSFEAHLDLDLSVLYLMAALTKIPSAHHLINVPHLIPVLLKRSTECLSSRDRRYRSMATLSTLILRHLVETPKYLALLVENEVTTAVPTSFGGRSRLKAFVTSGHLEYILCRDFGAFRSAVAKHYGLTWEDNNWQVPEELCICGRKSFSKGEDQAAVPSPPTLEELQNIELSPMAKDIVHCLMDELVKVDIFPPTDSAEANEKAEGDEMVVLAHFKRCSLIVALAELIHSYPICREAFITAPKLSDFMTFLFDKMTPSGELAGTLGSRVFVNESMWVSQLLEICIGPHQIASNDKLGTLPDRVKLVVDSLALSLRRFLVEYSPSIDNYPKMSRAWCLTMTVYVLINSKSGSSSRILGPAQAAVTARMLEKGYISLLSTMLKNIDIKAPMAPMVAAKIIFSLEIITRLGNRLARIATGATSSLLMDDTYMDEDFDEEGFVNGNDSEESDDEDDEDGDSMEEDLTDGEDMIEMDIDGEGDDDSAEGDEDEEDDDMDMEVSTFSGGDYEGDEEDETDDTDDSDNNEDDDMMYSDIDEISGDYRVIVHPPVSRSGPAAEAVASGFQVIPMVNISSENNRNAFRANPFGDMIEDIQDHRHHHRRHHHNHEHDHYNGNNTNNNNNNEEEEDEDEEDEYMSDESMEEDDDEEEGFSVEEEDYADDGTAVFDDGLVMSLRPRMGTFARRVLPGRIFREMSGQTYSSQAREADVYVHPLVGGRLDPIPRSYGFDVSRLPQSNFEADIEAKIWQENQDVFHSPTIITTMKRWGQESKLFLGDDAQSIAIDAIPILLEGMLPDAELRRAAERERMEKSLAEESSRGGQSLPKKDEQMSKSTTRQFTSLESLDNLNPDAVPPSALEVATPPTVATFEDFGPDREFLEALPFEMRREVLEQYFEERRRNVPEGAEVIINEEFLNSLSGDLREDYQRQSQQEIDRYRRRGSSRMISQLDINALLENLGADMQRTLADAYEVDVIEEPLSSSNSSRPSRRPNSEQVSQIISALSDSMRRLRDSAAAGSGVMVESSIGAGGGGGGGMSQSSSSEALVNTAGASTTGGGGMASTVGIANNNNQLGVSIAKRDYANMIDVASLASILRVYYNPLITEDRTHIRLFQHLCAGQSPRADLLNMLIYILEEMPDDVAQLDSVLDNYVSISSTIGSSSTTGGGSKGKLTTASTSTVASGSPKVSTTALRKKSPLAKTNISTDSFGGSTYVVIQQRTLQVLMQLVQHNEDVRKFFTACYESPWTIQRIDKKGEKGSRLAVTTTKYPIVLLLACLERPGFVQIPLLVENLLHLLQMVTVPLKELTTENNKSREKEKKTLLPDIPNSFVSSLVRAIIQCESSPKAFQYSTMAFQNLSLIETVANTILMELSDLVARLAEGTTKEVVELCRVVKLKDKAAINESLKTLSQSTSSQSRLLRGMKMLSSTILRPLKVDEERSKAFDCLIETFGVNWTRTKETTSKECWNDLFKAVDSCLVAIGQECELYHVATGLLPTIESHFWHVRQVAVLLPENLNKEEEIVFSFAEKNRVILNTMIRANPTLLTTGAFILLTKMPRVLDFDNKRSWFKQQLVKKGTSRPSLSIHVRRAHVFEDSFHAIMGRSGEEVKLGRLSIKFHEEEGLDAGGVTREWFAVLSRQMFDPNYALFKVSAVDKITYQPNRMSYINPDHLQYFTFIGRIIGKAIYDNRLLDCYFTRSFYKHILHIPVDFKDLEAVDPEFYKSLVWILENDNIEAMELTFSVESDEFGIHKITDLKPGGRSISVTDANKKEYVRLVTENKLTSTIEPQINAFLKGFHEVIPESLISIFNEQELELLISGMPDIDVDDWKNNTEYTGYNVSSPQIQWFWRAVRSFDQEYRAKLLQFVTGTSKVPLDGFSNLQGSSGIQKFQIHRDYGAKDRLPSAHTCFNQLDLPEYETYELLRDMMLKAVNECSTGFGLV